MATDYDAPRTNSDEEEVESVEELKRQRAARSSNASDVDVSEEAESVELPGADLSGEELTVRVVPVQGDEFTCSRCFMVHHRSRFAGEEGGRPVCLDCSPADE
ncbi:MULTISPECIES: DUF4193 domain-containing protein [unclassified Streptomyces]|uniref:DUF4193 domain-containing protein n=1 Tax=Streptomycetaceae TaxID=2062 RepID=UPI002E75D4B7|nr:MULTISPECIES: DUF4193 domain-containing protein [unclassified Streptomyces]MED7954530.1 DUF4193 domain-containing protein [Streptomyces sp. BE303]MEE1824719.1 DUF4193 domain-containing protein [Streptomyces sp. BE20]